MMVVVFLGEFDRMINVVIKIDVLIINFFWVRINYVN